MKVICIDGEKPRPKEYKGFIPLVNGDTYEVIDHYIGRYTDGSGVQCYILRGIDWGYEVDRFIPLSEIDELELAAQREAVTV